MCNSGLCKYERPTMEETRCVKPKNEMCPDLMDDSPRLTDEYYPIEEQDYEEYRGPKDFY